MPDSDSQLEEGYPFAMRLYISQNAESLSHELI